MPMVDISQRELETLRQLIAEHERKLAADDVDIEPIELTEREQEILILLFSGYDNAQISTTCEIASSTVKSHIYSIFGKLGAHNARHAIAIGLRLKLLSVDDLRPWR